ncbi:major capsid protein [Treponema denticola]
MSNSNLNLKSFFTMDANIQRLKRLPELKTPILDLVYPENRRINYPKSIICAEDLPKEIKNIPVIKRGTQAVAVTADTQAQNFEPFPIEASLRISAAELNDIISLGFATQQSFIDQKVDRLRRITRATTEALAAQSLTGKIQYALKTSSEDKNLYTADYGATQSFSPAEKWNTQKVTIAEIITDCLSMTDKISGTGFGTQVVILLNAGTFAIVIKKILESKTNPLNIAINENSIMFPGFTMMRIGSSYYDYQTKKDTPIIPDNKVCAIAIDAPHWLPYCAIDDLDANLAPLPFFSKTEKLANPSAWEIYGKSKPFPVPIVDAICWAEVL